MTISIRLTPEEEARLREQAELTDVGISEFVRVALKEKLERDEPRTSAYDLGAHLFGKFDSGDAGLSANRKTKLKALLRAKHSD